MDRYEFGKNIADITEPRYVVERFSPTTVGIFVVGNPGYLRDTHAPTEVGEEILRLVEKVEWLNSDPCGNALTQRVTALEADLAEARDTIERQKEVVAAARGHAGALAASIVTLKRDLAEARESGLSLGNAALKKGWEDCEKAVVTYIRGTYMTREGLARTIEEGRHRPQDFNAHAPAWTGADELTPEEVMARCDPFPDGEPAANPFAYPAGLPEEDPGSAPEETEQTRLRSLHELAQAARLYPELFFAQHTLAKLREAGVIPGE